MLMVQGTILVIYLPILVRGTIRDKSYRLLLSASGVSLAVSPPRSPNSGVREAFGWCCEGGQVRVCYVVGLTTVPISATESTGRSYAVTTA